MKKFFAIFCISFLTCALFTSCGPSWDQERAQELCSKPFEELTPGDFDEMCDLIEAGWAKVKSSETADKDPEFSRLFFSLGGRANSMAHATKRVVSDSQSAAYDELAERIKKEMAEEIQKRNKKD